MFFKPYVVSGTGETSDEELRMLFGEEAIVTRLGQYNLIHLDDPSPEEIERRRAEFNPDELFDDDCALCRMLRGQPANIVYDESGWDEEN